MMDIFELKYFDSKFCSQEELTSWFFVAASCFAARFARLTVQLT